MVSSFAPLAQISVDNVHRDIIHRDHLGHGDVRRPSSDGLVIQKRWLKPARRDLPCPFNNGVVPTRGRRALRLVRQAYSSTTGTTSSSQTNFKKLVSPLPS